MALEGLHHQALTGPSCGRPEAQHTGLRLEDPLSELKHRGRCTCLTLQGEGRFRADPLLVCGFGEQRTRRRSLQTCQPVTAGMPPGCSQHPSRPGPRAWLLPCDGDRGRVGWPPCFPGSPGVQPTASWPRGGRPFCGKGSYRPQSRAGAVTGPGPSQWGVPKRMSSHCISKPTSQTQGLPDFFHCRQASWAKGGTQPAPGPQRAAGKASPGRRPGRKAVPSLPLVLRGLQARLAPAGVLGERRYPACPWSSGGCRQGSPRQASGESRRALPVLTTDRSGHAPQMPVENVVHAETCSLGSRGLKCPMSSPTGPGLRGPSSQLGWEFSGPVSLSVTPRGAELCPFSETTRSYEDRSAVGLRCPPEIRDPGGGLGTRRTHLSPYSRKPPFLLLRGPAPGVCGPNATTRPIRLSNAAASQVGCEGS